MSVEKDLLEAGIKELYERGKITTDVKNSIEVYIDNISLLNVKEINYKDFNEDASSDNLVFSGTQRKVEYLVDSEIGELRTNLISLTNIKITDLKLQGLDENVTYLISYDGIIWLSIDSYNINEIVESSIGFYIKIKLTESNTIFGLKVVYENL